MLGLTIFPSAPLPITNSCQHSLCHRGGFLQGLSWKIEALNVGAEPLDHEPLVALEGHVEAPRSSEGRRTSQSQEKPSRLPVSSSKEQVLTMRNPYLIAIESKM